MLWLKRNMVLAVSGLLALLAVGGGVYYLLASMGDNSKMDEELRELQSQMDKILTMKPYPSTTNIMAGREEIKRLEQAVTGAVTHFLPIPYEKVTGLAFKTALDNAIFELTRKAEAARTTLPDTPYYFSFAEQKKKLNLDSGSFPGINMQLAEVKVITEILFDAKVHSLIGLKRVRVSTDDPAGSKDYRPEWSIETNEVTKATLTPYEVSFTGFSADLANVLDGLVRSKHGLMIRAVAVDRFEEKQARQGPARQGIPNPVNVMRRTTVPRPPANPNENRTILNEERFLVVIWLAVIRPQDG